MKVSGHCEQCGSAVEFELENAGKIIRCNECGLHTELRLYDPAFNNPQNSKSSEDEFAREGSLFGGRRRKTCHFCQEQIARSVRICPHCARVQPVKGVNRGGVVLMTVLFVVLLRGCWTSPQNAIDRGPNAEWLEASGNIWIGTRLYLKSEHIFVCTVVAVEPSHIFPDGTTREGVQVIFKDQTSTWVPREAVKRIYVVRSDELPK